MILKGCALLGAVAAVLKTIGESWFLLPLYFVEYFLVFFAVVLAFLAVACACVDMDKPQEKESKFFRVIVYPYVELLMNLFLVKLSTRGLEKIPAEGRFLLVCNHQQFADPGILLHCFPKSRLIFISKQENRKLPVINKFLHALRCQMLDRDNDRQALRVILNCIKMIKDDEVSVGVFPEGYTSKDGKLHHFRSGVFKIAQKANVPIVVCTINGTGPLFRNVVRLKRTPVDLHLVDIIPAEELKGKHTNEIAERVYEIMIADLGEEFRYTEQNT